MRTRDLSTYLDRISYRGTHGATSETLRALTLDPCQPVDYHYPNYFHSHSSESRFMQRRVCTIPTKDGRKTLVDRSLSIRRNGTSEKSVADSDADYARLLREHFGIVL